MPASGEAVAPVIVDARTPAAVLERGLCVKLADWNRATVDDQRDTCALCPVIRLCEVWIRRAEADLSDTQLRRQALYAGMTGTDRLAMHRGKR